MAVAAVGVAVRAGVVEDGIQDGSGFAVFFAPSAGAFVCDRVGEQAQEPVLVFDMGEGIEFAQLEAALGECLGQVLVVDMGEVQAVLQPVSALDGLPDRFGLPAADVDVAVSLVKFDFLGSESANGHHSGGYLGCCCFVHGMTPSGQR